jgi:hypothetical protein
MVHELGFVKYDAFMSLLREYRVGVGNDGETAVVSSQNVNEKSETIEKSQRCERYCTGET